MVGREFGREREGVRGGSRPEDDELEVLGAILVLDSDDNVALYFLTFGLPDDAGTVAWLRRPEEVIEAVQGMRERRAAMAIERDFLEVLKA